MVMVHPAHARVAAKVHSIAAAERACVTAFERVGIAAAAPCEGAGRRLYADATATSAARESGTASTSTNLVHTHHRGDGGEADEQGRTGRQQSAFHGLSP